MVSKYLSDQWLVDNDHTYKAFERVTLDAIKGMELAGRIPRLGAKAIAEQLRWHNLFKRKDEAGYVVNNSYVTAMAHCFVRNHPHYARVFAFRTLEHHSKDWSLTT